MYHTNYQVRMDKTALILNYGQNPLVKTRYLDYLNKEENPYGENAIVAIMCYTGYNVEDAILVNEGALKRGLFRTTYFTTYEAHEEKEKQGEETTQTTFSNIENDMSNPAAFVNGDYKRLLKLHFSMVNKKGIVIEKGLVSIPFPNNVNNIYKIRSNYLPLAAKKMMDKLPFTPTPVVNQKKGKGVNALDKVKR